MSPSPHRAISAFPKSSGRSFRMSRNSFSASLSVTFRSGFGFSFSRSYSAFSCLTTSSGGNAIGTHF